MGHEETVPATVVFSWEHEPGVSKQSPWARKAVSTTAVGAGDMPESPRKAQAPARRLSVPPPPGRASSMPVTRSFSQARAVRPEDDPFLAAYLACTKSTKTGGGGAREAKGRRRLTWARLGLSCKSSNGVVEESMVRLSNSKLPEVHPNDA